MILKLNAMDFGKFKGRVFELGPVTVVHGPNEAGKTTFFDALFQALCRPSETKVMGKALKRRYGAARRAEAVLAGPFEIGEDEFLNLFAIRAGDLSIELGKGSPWIEALKARLFHGGLDPAALAAEFERRSSDRRNFVHMRDLEALRESASKARGELESRRRERDALLGEERSLAAAEAALEETRRLREAGMAALKDAREKLAFEESVEKRRKLADRLARLDERAALEARFLALEAFRADRRGEFDLLSESAKAAAAKAQACRTRLELQGEQAAKARAEERRLEDLRDYHAGRAALAATLAGELRQGVAPARMPFWLPLAVALPPLLGAALGWSLSLLPQVGAAAMGLLLGGALALWGRRRIKAEAAAKAAEQVASVKDRFAVGELEWASRHPQAAGEVRGGLAELATREGILQALERIAQEGPAWERQWHSARRQAADLAEEKARLEAAVQEADGLLDEARRAEREWLARQGVDRIEDYALQVARLAEVREAREALARRGDEAGRGGAGPEDERRDLERQLRALDEEGIPRQGMDEAALQRLRNQAKALEAERAERDRLIEETASRNALQAGRVRGTLGKLAGEIVRAEEALLDLEAKVAEKELDRRAAGVACEIFREIGEGADLLLAGLARELEATLGRILPGERAVAMLGLDQKQIRVQDAGGEARALEHLSSGTQDAVVLAAKLALARTTRPGPGLLVLDDPFQAMDAGREERALAMLQDFHLRHGWQIILLTKTAHLRDGMARIFPGLKVLEL